MHDSHTMRGYHLVFLNGMGYELQKKETLQVRQPDDTIKTARYRQNPYSATIIRFTGSPFSTSWTELIGQQIRL